MIDTPPGTSDEHISVVQYLSGTPVDGAVLITTPQVTGNNFNPESDNYYAIGKSGLQGLNDTSNQTHGV